MSDYIHNLRVEDYNDLYNRGGAAWQTYAIAFLNSTTDDMSTDEIDHAYYIAYNLGVTASSGGGSTTPPPSNTDGGITNGFSGSTLLTLAGISLASAAVAGIGRHYYKKHKNRKAKR